MCPSMPLERIHKVAKVTALAYESVTLVRQPGPILKPPRHEVFSCANAHKVKPQAPPELLNHKVCMSAPSVSQVTRSHAISKSSSLTSGEWNSHSLITVLCMVITLQVGASETTCRTQANSMAHHTGVWMINNNACLVDEGAEGGIT